MSARPETTGDVLPLQRRRPAVLPVGTDGEVTFLFSDVEGSTQLFHALGDAYAGLLATHHAVVVGVAERHGGVLVSEEGDGLFFAFDRAADACEAAGQVQRALAAMTWPAGAEVRVRMGLHTGPARPVGGQYVSLAVHQAARISAAAHGGQVLMSAETAAAAGASARGLGRYRLKDFPEPVELLQLDADGLPTDFPALRTPPADAPSLPTPGTTFVGRSLDRARLAEALDEHRLVSLVGPGGAGKTRVAVEVCDARRPHVLRMIPVDLAALPVGAARSHVAQALLRAAGSPTDADDDPLASLTASVQRHDVLWLLDNAEHVLDGLAEVLEQMLAATVSGFLVTSRAPVELPGERVIRLEPLSVPEVGAAPDEVAATDAGRLLLERVPDLVLDTSSAALVTALARRLDGIPLALELAAAHVPHLGLAEVVAEVERDGELLDSSAGRGRSARTLRATLEWSLSLLDPPSRQLWQRLAVFAGPFTLDAAREVCADDQLPPSRVATLLSGLVRCSLVAQVPDVGRFALHAVPKERGREMLEASPESAALRDRHATWAAGRSRAFVLGRRSWAGMREMGSDRDDVAAAAGRVPVDDERWSWTRAGLMTDARFASRYAESLSLADEVLRELATGDTPARALALACAGATLERCRDDPSALAALDRCRLDVDDVEVRCYVLAFVANLTAHWYRDDEAMRQRSKAALDELALWQEETAGVLLTRAALAMSDGDADGHERLLAAAAERAAAEGDDYVEFSARLFLADRAQETGDPRAVELAEQALAVGERMGGWMYEAPLLTLALLDPTPAAVRRVAVMLDDAVRSGLQEPRFLVVRAAELLAAVAPAHPVLATAVDWMRHEATETGHRVMGFGLAAVRTRLGAEHDEALPTSGGQGLDPVDLLVQVAAALAEASRQT